MPMKDTILRIGSLTKNFSTFTAVDNICLDIGKGEIFGFLGPNGAGKTTTIKLVAGLLAPTSGYLEIMGRNLGDEPSFCKANTGYIPDRPYLYEKLTGGEYLGFIASLYEQSSGDSLAEADQYLDMFDLANWKNHLIEGYSHGMRQKLIMTSIFMLNQPLIVVDEPMVGLDPKSARIVKELFKAKAEAGATIFLSTHSMEIAEELCSRIAIIVEGAIKEIGAVEDLRVKAKNSSSNLEDIFLELTGAFELQNIIEALKNDSNQTVTGTGE